MFLFLVYLNLTFFWLICICSSIMIIYYLIKITFKNFTRKNRLTVLPVDWCSPFAPGSPLLPVGCQPGPQPGSVPLCQVLAARPSLLVGLWAAEGSVHAESGCRLRPERGECHGWGLSWAPRACGVWQWPRYIFPSSLTTGPSFPRGAFHQGAVPGWAESCEVSLACSQQWGMRSPVSRRVGDQLW